MHIAGVNSQYGSGGYIQASPAEQRSALGPLGFMLMGGLLTLFVVSALSGASQEYTDSIAPKPVPKPKDIITVTVPDEELHKKVDALEKDITLLTDQVCYPPRLSWFQAWVESMSVGEKRIMAASASCLGLGLLFMVITLI
jgi:hypothetical protein